MENKKEDINVWGLWQTKKEDINIWDSWEKEWKNAYNFFNSKGNVHTKSKLKDKWFKEFVKILEDCAK